MGVSTNRGPLFLGPPKTRIIVCWDLFWGSPFMEARICGAYGAGHGSDREKFAVLRSSSSAQTR